MFFLHMLAQEKKNNHTLAMAPKVHILAVPFPLQGHISPMIQLCNRLSSKGIRVTVVTSVAVSSLLKKQGEAGNDLIDVETVPDVAVDGVENLDEFEAYIRRFRAAITSGLPDIIDKYSGPLRAVVYGSVIPWVLDVAHAKGLKGASLFTQSCGVCAVYYHMQKGSLEIPPEDGPEVSLPGLPAMGAKDLPSLVYDKGSYASILRAVLEQFSALEKADWQLFNTFDKLEDEILKWMAEKYPIQTIGPTVPSMYTDKRIPGNYDYGLSFFKPKTESCMKWLDEKEDSSVVYVAFGSFAGLSEKQMSELAWGLIDSKRSFLWVVRDTEQRKLPQDWASSAMEKGLVVNWCPQLGVLSHRAIGCFFTHCGWNSTLEGLSLGVPMVAMAQWTDQPTNGKMIADVWRIGVRVKADGDGIVTREEIAECVDSVMEGEKGNEIRRNSLKWKGLAIDAVSEGGSSDKNIAEFARQLINM